MHRGRSYCIPGQVQSRGNVLYTHSETTVDRRKNKEGSSQSLKLTLFLRSRLYTAIKTTSGEVQSVG